MEEELKLLKTPEHLSKLKGWMNYEWNFSCHTKYRHLFEEWWKNITDSQIYYFSKQMYNLEHGILGKTSNYFKK